MFLLFICCRNAYALQPYKAIPAEIISNSNLMTHPNYKASIFVLWVTFKF